jgi:hypothetical protein
MVPLRDSGYAVGVLSRASGDGHCFGYFFGPRVYSEAQIAIDALTPEGNVLAGKFGDLELLRGNWKTVGRIPDWDPKRWDIKPLARVDEEAGKAWLSIYDDNFNCVEEREVSVAEAKKYPYDRMMGAGAVEIRLTKILDSN